MTNLVDVFASTEAVLSGRPARAPNYQAENEALSRLAAELAVRSDNVLTALCEEVLKVCDADSSGVSLLSGEDFSGDFIWPAVAGAWASYTGGGMPRSASPCGVVVERNAPLLFHDVAKNFPAVAHASPPIWEILLVPFCIDGRPLGTVWAVAHTARKAFDREDQRILESIAKFAAAAHQIHQDMERRTEEKRRRDAVLLLGDELRDNLDPDAVVHLGAKCLATGLSADRAGYGSVDPENETVDVLGDWCAIGISSVKGRHSLRSFGSPIDVLKTGVTISIPDVRVDEMTNKKQASYEAISARSLLTCRLWNTVILSP